MKSKEKQPIKIKLLTFLQDRHTYSMETNILFFVQVSTTFLCFVSLVGTSILNFYPEARWLWIVGIVFSLTNMEICLTGPFLKYSKLATQISYTFVLVPLGLYFAGSILTPSVLYSFFALLLVNLITYGATRWIYSIAIVLMVVLYALNEMKANTDDELMATSGELYILWICFFAVIALITTILMHVTTTYLLQYNEKNTKHTMELKTLSITDALTTLYNKRYFKECMEQSMYEQKRAEDSFALLMLDVDNFKQYNDNYGHYEGDNCLKIVSNVLNQCLYRKTDMAFRVGGEEFAILLHHVSDKDVYSITMRIHEELASIKLEHLQSNGAKCVTISIGGLIVNGKAHYCLEEIVKGADNALYESKKQGKNCSTIYSMTDRDLSIVKG